MRPLVAGSVLAVFAAAPAQATTEVSANGNFLGGLSFTPAEITVPVGEVVRWRNTDSFVPHTSTEDHGLWDLAGTYGQTPFNPPGFAPGATVERPFEAGTHDYYCRVHGKAQQSGTVSVPVTLARERVRRRARPRRRRGRRFRVIRFVVATWAPAAPVAGLVFDVERRRGDGSWTPLRTATTETGARFRAGARGTVWEVRARLRREGSDDQATGWSPAAAVTA